MMLSSETSKEFGATHGEDRITVNLKTTRESTFTQTFADMCTIVKWHKINGVEFIGSEICKQYSKSTYSITTRLPWPLSGALNMYRLCLSNFDTIINFYLVVFFTLTVYAMFLQQLNITYFLNSLITLMMFYVKFIQWTVLLLHIYWI